MVVLILLKIVVIYFQHMNSFSGFIYAMFWDEELFLCASIQK